MGPTEDELHKRWGLTRQAAHNAVHAISGRNLRVTSGFRSEWRNRSIGGVPGSLHTKRRAVDLVGARADLVWVQRHAPEHGATEALHEYIGTAREHLHLGF
jgi:predicted Rdx family selenoprotein